ncbi:MAG: hypothetical protein KDK96_10225 [Chlamydiia bacterium]|nr:hypothetical protein [Chlamydiia bacterium]
MKMQVSVNKFYPEEFRRKSDAEKYHSKGTCEVHLLLGPIEMDLKNITYRIDHEGKVSLKPPFRVHSNKKAGIKPKLVPSIVFKKPSIWGQIEQTIKSELSKEIEISTKCNNECLQLELWEKVDQ